MYFCIRCTVLRVVKLSREGSSNPQLAQTLARLNDLSKFSQWRSCWHQTSSHLSIFQRCCFHFRNRFVRNRRPSRKVVRHGLLYVLWTLRITCVRVVCSYSLLRKLRTFGNECNLVQCFLHIQNVSQSVIRTWRTKRVGTPSLTAAKPRLSTATSWLRWLFVLGKPWHAPHLGRLAYKRSRWL